MPTAKSLHEAFPRDLSLEQARELSKVLRTGLSGRQADDVLLRANELIGGHGIEAIQGEHTGDGYYQDIVGLYVNTGDTYNATIVFDTQRRSFSLTTFGDWVEKNQRKYKII